MKHIGVIWRTYQATMVVSLHPATLHDLYSVECIHCVFTDHLKNIVSTISGVVSCVVRIVTSLPVLGCYIIIAQAKSIKPSNY